MDPTNTAPTSPRASARVCDLIYKTRVLRGESLRLPDKSAPETPQKSLAETLPKRRTGRITLWPRSCL